MAYFGRGPNRVQNPYVLKDMYEEYLKDKEEGSPYRVPYDLFVSLCTEYYKGVMDHIFDSGIFFMPYRMGNVSIIKKKPKRMDSKTLPVDWQKTNEIGKRVLQLNDHSNYYKFRFHWEKKSCYVSHKSGYRLEFTRANKRRLAQIIKSGDYDYFELN